MPFPCSSLAYCDISLLSTIRCQMLVFLPLDLTLSPLSEILSSVTNLHKNTTLLNRLSSPIPMIYLHTIHLEQAVDKDAIFATLTIRRIRPRCIYILCVALIYICECVHAVISFHVRQTYDSPCSPPIFTCKQLIFAHVPCGFKANFFSYSCI